MAARNLEYQISKIGRKSEFKLVQGAPQDSSQLTTPSNSGFSSFVLCLGLFQVLNRILNPDKLKLLSVLIICGILIIWSYFGLWFDDSLLDDDKS